MTERSYVYDGILVGDATIAPYSSAEWAELQRNLAGAARNNYGVLAGTGNGTQLALEVQATGPASATVNMFAGAAIVNGRLYINDATLNLAIGANASGNPRIDTVVIRRDTVAQTARAAVKQGTPAATPVPATLTQDATTWEISVAYITVANGFSTITQANIANCGQVVGGNAQQYVDDILNNTGVRLETGDVVSWDTTTARTVTLPALDNDSLVAGIWVGSTANGGRGRIQTEGLGWVKVSTLTQIGDGLIAKSADNRANLARANFYMTSFGIGRALESSVSTLILAYIQVQAHSAIYAHIHELASASPGGLASGSWVTRGVPSSSSSLGGSGITFDSATHTIVVAKNVPVAFHWLVPGYKVGTHSSRLFDVTNSVGHDGAVATSPAAAAVQTWSEGWFEANGIVSAFPITYRIEQQCGVTNGTDGLGIAPAAWQGANIPYTTVEVWRGWF